MRYFLILSCCLATLFALQALALRAVGGRTIKSESNFFSSLGRIQAGVQGSPEVMLLGSSITGRLPDRAQGFGQLANMGCDGGSAADTIRAIHEGRLPRAPIILVEANALHIAMLDESEVASAMHRPWFKLGLKIPLLSAYARPAAFLYSPLLARRTGNYGQAGGEHLNLTSMPGPAPDHWKATSLNPRENEITEELSGRIRDLTAAGSRVILVWLPPARPNGTRLQSWLKQLILDSGAEWWDLGQQADGDLIRLTDGVHMDAPSAGRTANSIIQALSSATTSN